MFIVTKGDTGPVAGIQVPEVSSGGLHHATRAIGKAIADKARATRRVTDGAFSADGRWVVLRTRNSLAFYRGPEFLKGDFQ